MKKNEQIDTSIMTLGTAKIPSPVEAREGKGEQRCFVQDEERILVNPSEDEVLAAFKNGKELLSFERAGPRRTIYFDPSKLRCGVVSCGGLCPGTNNIIRSIVLALYHNYGVKNICGTRYGFQGFISSYGHELMELTPESVSNIHESGGTVLGTSRGPQDIESIVDVLERMNIRLLFTIGGDGTMVASTKIADAITERGLKIGVIGIPKTIDNDIYLIDRSFGFETAVGVAAEVIRSAHNEATSALNGIGLVKLMGRHSGFIAAEATLAMPVVNFVLIPESDFDLGGPGGFLEVLKERLLHRKHAVIVERLLHRKHAVIVVAEGAGQKFFENEPKRYDASGNVRLHNIGLFLKEIITDYFIKEKMEATLKYIDPSYMIRSVPANTNDGVLCGLLARRAVHAGMAGKTKMLVGLCNNHFVHIPMEETVGKRRQVDC
ncbi:MAG: ATP-dependent 6-phosphofructokinase, partial [Deltaproteobacteria bacterium]|nr:ATP-dependent 6-phosphofructokinase [Deltaproteobacteria bacterium]